MKEIKDITVVVGMSGGVDSSVAAYLLKKQGYNVIGLFMRNWNDASVTLEDECPWIDDSRDAMLVAEQLEIPFQVIDLSDKYKERIVDYMFREYEKGRTPNPDVLCNREIKFDIFLDNALKLGADFVATGHYVRKRSIETSLGVEHQLISGKDPNKDQSYFLCQLNQFQLSKAMFPIGEMLKSEVREVAEIAGLITAKKKDSQGLCFIGKVSLPDFLQQQLKTKEGVVIEIDENLPKLREHFEGISNDHQNWDARIKSLKFNAEDGKVIGKHNGAHFYTIGQRKGLQIGGKPKPLFVLQTDIEKNIIFVGQGEEHIGLYSAGIRLKSADLHFVRDIGSAFWEPANNLKCRIRYRQNLFGCSCKMISDSNEIVILFDRMVKAVTPGQFIAFYLEDELVASAEIMNDFSIGQ